MTKNKTGWNSYFYRDFSGFASISPFWQKHEGCFLSTWPTVEEFNMLAKNLSFEFVQQDKNTNYVYDTFVLNKIPMRPNCWHDFFNNLTWLIWPELKNAIVNKIMKEANNALPHRRAPLQDLLTHFDECGIVICSSQREIFEYIESFSWQKLFLDTKNLQEICEIVIFGHGLMEKCLTPYIGMTGKALFLLVESDFFGLSFEEKMKHIDIRPASYILTIDYAHYPQSLAPFPFLGWPQWWPHNQTTEFFANTDYFRPKKVQINNLKNRQILGIK